MEDVEFKVVEITPRYVSYSYDLLILLSLTFSSLSCLNSPANVPPLNIFSHSKRLQRA